MPTFNNITQIKFVTLNINGGTISPEENNENNFTLILTNEGITQCVITINAYDALQPNGFVGKIDIMTDNQFNVTCDGYYLSSSISSNRQNDPKNWGLFVSSDGHEFSLPT